MKSSILQTPEERIASSAETMRKMRVFHLYFTPFLTLLLGVNIGAYTSGDMHARGGIALTLAMLFGNFGSIVSSIKIKFVFIFFAFAALAFSVALR